MTAVTKLREASRTAVSAGAGAMFAAVAAGRLPRWLRVTVVFSLVVLACAAGLLGYRYISRPAVLTVATGSVDGDVTRLMSLVATRMAATNAPVQLRIIDKGTALDTANAFAAGETDLAVVRGDIGDLSAARSVVIMTYAVVLIAVPPGSSIESAEGLKAKTVA
ncbi:hypothetical protein [Bradyrhizobium australiense]|uniref:Uncharacterized protein n=1 Tax=Bradyrhizobium australiense TaxID=2721161 RepID=A0A7Y4GR40_9BRAD|nr:hypothetical protein [Bradyrhizobium australiense]NOJ40286.1 hypothetical protein [Bradyrhizobium australiense]